MAPQSAEGEAKVITLCGSTRFEAEFAEVNQRLTMEGYVVISLGMFSLPDLPGYDWTADDSDLKGRLGGVHFQKIRMADELYIVDPGGYLGESTRREIAYAESLGKPVRYLSRERLDQLADGHQEVEGNSVTHTAGAIGGDSSRPWQTLASGFEQARAREDSLDRLVEWPAQRTLLGDVTGLAVLDAGCGNGAKLAQLAGDGAAASVGVDISGNFIKPPPGVELIEGDLSDLAAVPGLASRRFDRILFLQSFGYAADGVKALQTAREMLTEDGYILLTRTQPIRYAIERAEQKGTSLGEEYFATESFAYRHRNWNEQVTLTKRPYTMSDLLNTFSAAGLWIEAVVEPQLSAEAAERYPHKQAVMNKYLGILMFKLRPLPGQPTYSSGARVDTALADPAGGRPTGVMPVAEALPNHRGDEAF
ncbi:methyltransferase family protein [Kribbella amoyensis]|uniref:Methyltransferase family protein n=1 Tax=Kribbella amoyensis TaxID=996641 RepID=A0A561BZ56_9ACTN|nr:methyltransferase family protein [Kribbella amoyensis]